MATISPISTNSTIDAAVLNAAQATTRQDKNGNTVTPYYSNQFNHQCARGAQGYVSAAMGNPTVTVPIEGKLTTLPLFSALASNADSSSPQFLANTNLFQQPVTLTKDAALTSDTLNNLPYGTVVTIVPANGGIGHQYVQGDSSYISDNVNDPGAQHDLNGSRYANGATVYISYPTEAGTQAIQQNLTTRNLSLPANLTNGTNSSKINITYSAPPTIENGQAVGGQGTTVFGNPNNADPAITPDQIITLNDQFFTSLGPGAAAPVEPLAALQTKAQGKYSNRQFVSQISLKMNVEGVYKDIDFLQKEVRTSSYNPYKTNAVLFTNNQARVNAVFANNNTDRTSRTLNKKRGIASQILNIAGAPTSRGSGSTSAIKQIGTTVSSIFNEQHNLTQSIVNTGNNAITQNLTNRVPNVQSLIGQNALGSTVFSYANQIPGVSTLTSGVNSVISNPLGALQRLDAATLNIQAGLPSVSLGSLGDVFKLASNVASSGPPTSLSGIVSLEQQIKAIICNFVIPVVTFPGWDTLFKFNGKQLIDQIKREIKKEIDMITNPLKKFYKEVSDFFKPEHLKKLLAELLPDPNELFKAVIKELTTCSNGPKSKKADLSGKGASAGGINTGLQNATAGFKYVVPNANAGQGPINQ
jgi:hypothetical protein